MHTHTYTYTYMYRLTHIHTTYNVYDHSKKWLGSK